MSPNCYLILRTNDIFRTNSFDGGRKLVEDEDKTSSEKTLRKTGSLLDLGRRRSWQRDEEPLSGLFFDLGLQGGAQSKQTPHGGLAPIVVVSQPDKQMEEEESETEEEDETETELKKPDQTEGRRASTTQDPPYRHYVHENKENRRPSIVSRNLRKLFGGK